MTPAALLCAPAPLTARADQLLTALQTGGWDVRLAAAPDDGAAELVLWCAPALRTVPLSAGPTLHVVDVHGVGPDPKLVQGAGLLLAGSEAEAGAWIAAGTEAPVCVVPYAVPAEARATPAGTLCLLQGPAPSAATRSLARRAAAWAAARGVAIRPLPAAALLDVRAGPGIAPPDAWIEALSAGIPVLCCAEAPLLPRLLDAGAGVYVPALEAGLDAFAALPSDRLAAMRQAATDVARQCFAPADAARALWGGIRRAQAAAAQRRAQWQPGGTPPRVAEHVLVISDEALHLIATRIHRPLATLHRRGAIGGYSVLRHGEIDVAAGPAPAGFDAILVHRSVDPAALLLLRALDRPFAYDVDDNLLASPAYRPAFPPETIETAEAMLRGCTVLCCATPRLAGLLQRRGGIRLADKAIVAPNLAVGAPPPRPPGPPSAVLWASSDAPALTRSRATVEQAVVEFCGRHGLTLVCLGAAPALAEAGIAVQHIGLLPHAEYLARLRSYAPAILVCPLETDADPATQDFVDGKSDVKAIDAALAGLVGVYSRAAPYTDSALARILCDNTRESWLAGLEQARTECLEGAPAPAIPQALDAGRLGPLPWADAIARARLPRPLTRRALHDALAFAQAQEAAVLADPAEFDEEDYLGRHEDVRLAVVQGVIPSGYEHFRRSGYQEGRAARKRQTVKTRTDAWWSLLLRTVARLEDAADARDLDFGIPPSSPPPDAASGLDLLWRPAATATQPCPACTEPGPHAALLRMEGETLLRCEACTCCFYEHRAAYDYEQDQGAATLVQFTLEQNAGIYHQLRLPAAVDDPLIDSLLDVGCGFGFGVDWAAKVAGWRAVGIDPSFYATEGRAALRADIRTGWFTAETPLGPPFSLVLCSEVIEHVPDPFAFLMLLRARLKPGGTLILTTPDAAALEPGQGEGTLIVTLAVRVHLVLFTLQALEVLLRRAGFAHVLVSRQADGLVAYASDMRVRLRPESELLATYLQYLRHLVETAEPGSAIWNGGAGRLLAWQAPHAPLADLQALYEKIRVAWWARFGLDLDSPDVVARMAEASFRVPDPVTAAQLGACVPFNLPGVLFNRAVMQYRTEGRTPASVLPYARAAYTQAVQSRRVLQAERLIDLDLKLTAWRARLLMVDCLAELAPELEGELLHAVAQRSPGALHDRIDPPMDMLIQRTAPWFAKAVQADRFEEARRLEPWMRDLDALCAATAGDLEQMFRALFAVGVLHLVGDGAPGPAMAAFRRMQREAEARPGDPAAQHFLPVAREHVQLAAGRLP